MSASKRKIRLKVQNLDGDARRTFDTAASEAAIVERLEYLCAVEGWDVVVVKGHPYSILGSNLATVAKRIKRAR